MDHGDVHDKTSFARYIVRIIAQLDDPVRSRDLQNDELRSLLDAMEAWALDSDQPANSNPWRHAADVLRAGLTYQ